MKYIIGNEDIGRFLVYSPYDPFGITMRSSNKENIYKDSEDWQINKYFRYFSLKFARHLVKQYLKSSLFQAVGNVKIIESKI